MSSDSSPPVRTGRLSRLTEFGNLCAAVIAVLVPIARFVIHDDVLFGLTAVVALALGAGLIGLELRSPSPDILRHAVRVIASTLVFGVGVCAMTARVIKPFPPSAAATSSTANTPAQMATTPPLVGEDNGAPESNPSAVAAESPGGADSIAPPPAPTSAIQASINVPKPNARVAVSTEFRGNVRGAAAARTLWVVLQVAGPADNPVYQAGREKFPRTMWVFHVDVSGDIWSSTLVFDGNVPRAAGLVYGVKLVAVLPSYVSTLQKAEAAHQALPVDIVQAKDYQSLADVAVTLG